MSKEIPPIHQWTHDGDRVLLVNSHHPGIPLSFNAARLTCPVVPFVHVAGRLGTSEIPHTTSTPGSSFPRPSEPESLAATLKAAWLGCDTQDGQQALRYPVETSFQIGGAA
jgi:hypothetical protein